MTLNKLKLLFYTLLGIPISFIGLPIYIYVPEYYSSTFAINLALVGTIMLIIRLLDTVSDPLIGILSDKFIRYQNHIITISSILLGIFFYILFNPIIENKVINLIVFSFLTYSAFSVLVINHFSYLSNFENKMQISTTREMGTLIGLLIATISPSILMLKYSERETFFLIGILFMSSTAILAILFFFYSEKQIHLQTKIQKTKISFRFLKNKNFLIFLAFLLFNTFAIAAPSTLVLFFIKDFLELKNYTGLFLFLYFISAICFMPIWNFVSKKISPLLLLQIGIMGSILTFGWCYFLSNGSMYGYCAICILSGIFFGIDLTIPPVLTSLLIEKHNEEKSKMFIFSITHFIGKIGLAIISGVLLIILGNVSAQHYNFTLLILYTIIPCILKFIALILIKFIRII